MALCSYRTLLSKVTPCGPSSDYPGQEEFVTLKDCTKDVTRHLTTFKLSADEGSGTEMKLLLARAGNLFYKHKVHCLYHCFLMFIIESYKILICDKYIVSRSFLI